MLALMCLCFPLLKHIYPFQLQQYVISVCSMTLLLAIVTKLIIKGLLHKQYLNVASHLLSILKPACFEFDESSLLVSRYVCE